VTALAAATAGLTSHTGPGAPIRRAKLRFVVLAVVSPGSGMPGPLPMQDPQPGSVTTESREVDHAVAWNIG
jgi:hypothetical protein